jgi:hypothetical protein
MTATSGSIHFQQRRKATKSLLNIPQFLRKYPLSKPQWLRLQNPTFALIWPKAPEQNWRRRQSTPRSPHSSNRTLSLSLVSRTQSSSDTLQSHGHSQLNRPLKQAPPHPPTPPQALIPHLLLKYHESES